MKKARLNKGVLIVLLLTFLLSGWIAWGNYALEVNYFPIKSETLPSAFSGFRIAQVSDLHNTEIGEENKKLIDALRNAKPDIIAITGDIIDSRNTKIDVAISFATEAIKIAPCYYVTGNHEARIETFPELKEGLIKLGVTVLEDDAVRLERNGSYITIIGLLDPGFWSSEQLADRSATMNGKLSSFSGKEDTYRLLLSHRPEHFDDYRSFDIDLALTGHAYGGQIRLPFIGGIVAPNQGFFPKYDAGLFTEDDTSMIVSRGIGNSLLPFRVNNRPEVVLICLESV